MSQTTPIVSEYAKELASWEQHRTKYVPEGLQPGNPYTYRDYPKMLYCARRLPNGKWATSEVEPSRFGFRDDQEWDIACQAALNFTKSCQKTVHSPEEERKALESGEGWRPSQKEALEFQEGLQKDIGEAAAIRNWEDQRMSPKAKAESAEAEGEHFGHLGEIPRKPIKPRRQRRKPRKKVG